mmetsp:Transcript_4423/g.4958  ORF Transcript_4423/g.4958 Transcript_4423/m.4958 type:complete len:83 (+) Transcript_4423:1064-1312(+)
MHFCFTFLGNRNPTFLCDPGVWYFISCPLFYEKNKHGRKQKYSTMLRTSFNILVFLVFLALSDDLHLVESLVGEGHPQVKRQ